MIIYEVNIDIMINKKDKFKSWLTMHADKMLKFDGFTKYDIYNNKNNELSFCIHYHINSLENFEKYIDLHSNDMRLRGKIEFDGEMIINRRVLKKI